MSSLRLLSKGMDRQSSALVERGKEAAWLQSLMVKYEANTSPMERANVEEDLNQ